MGNFSIKSSLFVAILSWSLLFQSNGARDFASFGPLVTKESRRTIVSTECGAISAVDVHDGYTNEGTYHLEFITLDASSLFLPVILHRDMVFYVHTGRGTVNWISEDGSKNRIEVQRGDIYRLEEGVIFYVQTHPDPNREKLRIYAIFNTILDEKPSETCVGAYSNVSDLIRGFDDEILKMAFGVSEEVIQGIKGVKKPAPIVRFERKNETNEVDWREGIFEALIGRGSPFGSVNGKKKKKEKSTKPFNIYGTKPDVENCNGWSTAVTSNKFRPLEGSDIGMFIVNLTKGSMMGPHWNPKASEIAIATHGSGMVQIICPSNPSGVEKNCESTIIKVNEGDIFLVPRYRPMVQISFNNDSFVFVGFSTMANENHPQFLAGKRSALGTIDEKILAVSFDTSNTTMHQFLGSQIESIMFECASCAEELEKKMEEAEKQKKEEEAKKKEEEEARRREEKEEEERKRDEEERKKEEEARKEEKREEGEARKKEEEEEARKREEEERKREEEEARKKKEEETKKREEEEEARKREEQEEEARRKKEEREEEKREEEEARKKEEEEERKKEEEEARKKKEEETKKKEEEEARKREEEEEARKREEKEEEARRKEEEREEEESSRKEEEREKEARKREEEEARRKEEEREEEEERKRKEEEESVKEAEARRQAEEEEEEARREEEEETKGKQRPEVQEEEKQDGRESAFI